jgi:hypothetical protein
MRQWDAPPPVLDKLSFLTFELRESYRPFQLALISASCSGACADDNIIEAEKLLIALKNAAVMTIVYSTILALRF